MDVAITLIICVGLIIWYSVHLYRHRGDPKPENQSWGPTPRPVVPGVHCPSCGAEQASRVTGGQKLMSGVAGGILFSKSARSQFRCGNCRYLW